MEFQQPLFIDTRNQTINLSEGGISRSEDGVGRVSGRHEGQDIRIVVDKIAQNPKVMTNTGLHVGIVCIRISGLCSGTKITVCSSLRTTSVGTKAIVVEVITFVFRSSASVEGDTSLPGYGRQECR